MRPDPTGTDSGTRDDARIHNIGYRHYDGPRLGRGYARRALFSHSLRGSYGIGRTAKGKILPFALFAVVLVPVVGMVAIAITAGHNLPIDYTQYVLLMQPIIGIYLAFAAPQMVSLDLRFHTTPLYFSRPIERSDYVVSKFAALSAALFLFTSAPLVLMYVGALLGELGFSDQTSGFAQGLAGVAVFSALYAAIGLLVASLTPRRGFGVAAVIAVLTLPYFAVTAVQAVATEQQNSAAVGWLGLASPGSLIDGFQATYLGASTDFPGGHSPSDAAGIVYVLVIIGLIAVSYHLLMRRYRKAGL